ncbi:hypothetical protein [Noviherbaspirillum galbum]|uniref:Uncharacterized protein n=1 Tax=Noviherbaspirillum galbum TaxID=2709383 RepID=A0A6B3SU89_9BURK|nr:hypothetical protein [Noviherbaspirillum galbum]NEX64570.1 hypothetical protein [Noviherbaspirillum galbum]
MKNQITGEKPQSVVTAVHLLWAAFAIGLIRLLLDFLHLGTTSLTASTYCILICTFGLSGLLIFKVSGGRNWARITFLLVFVMGAMQTLPTALEEFSISAVVGALFIAKNVFQAYGLFLLFTRPGSIWFRKIVPA